MARSYSTAALLYDVSEGVATVTLNGPHEGNALDHDLARGVRAVQSLRGF